MSEIENMLLDIDSVKDFKVSNWQYSRTRGKTSRHRVVKCYKAAFVDFLNHRLFYSADQNEWFLVQLGSMVQLQTVRPERNKRLDRVSEFRGRARLLIEKVWRVM